MRGPGSMPVPKVGHVCLEPSVELDMAVKAADDLLKGGLPADKVAKIFAPVTEMYGPIHITRKRFVKVTKEERNSRNRNSRRSISVSRVLYNKLKAAAEAEERSMAGIVEEECAIFFNYLVKDYDS